MRISGVAWRWVDGRVAALLLALLLFLSPRRSLAENRFEYRYEDYSEDRGRMQVQTHSVWFEYDLHEKVVARGSYVNDALAGATPTGGPGYPGHGSSRRCAMKESAGRPAFIETDGPGGSDADHAADFLQ